MTETNEKKKKRIGKIVLHPATSFILLTIITIIISSVASSLGVQATHIRINPITGELQPQLIIINSLLNREGFTFIVSEAIRNFISFAPFALIIVFLVAFGVLDKSGLLKTLIQKSTNKLNRKTVTFLLFFFGMILNIFMETAYVILIPLGALIFLYNNRNPLLGIVAGFAAVAFGFSINMFVTPLDISIIHYTNMAAKVIDTKYQVGLLSNIYIMIAAVILLSWLGTFITEKIIIKKIGKYTSSEEENKEEVVEYKKKGFTYASITFIIITLLYLYMLIPGLPYSGLLLDYSEREYLKQLLGPTSYFQNSIPFLIALLFITTGIAYGLGAETFKSDKDIVKAMNNYMPVLTEIVVMIFFASQFISIFRRTNIGNIIVAWGGELIRASDFSGIPLIILTLLVIAFINIFMTSATMKWAILSPIIVPILMQMNITPEFSQVILKAGDSITNGITPLLAYFVIYLSFMNYYNKDYSEIISIKKGLSLTIPYSIAYTVFWILILVSWYLIGLPIGPGAYPTLPIF